jgi:hypothetical protein
MSSGAQSIALAVRRVFTEQRKLAAGGKEHFGDWHSHLANAMLKPLAKLFLEGAMGAKVTREMAKDLASLAKERAQESARSINQTTAKWLEEGRDLKQIFGVDRAVDIGITEATFAEGRSQTMAATSRGKKLKWMIDGGKPCPLCVAINGKVVKAGKPFARDRDGTPIYHPPYHPHCRCRVKEV